MELTLDSTEDINCKLCLRELKGRYYRFSAPDGMPQTSTHQLVICVSCYKFCMKIARMLEYGILNTQWKETEERANA